jgi:hypothetical protein
VTLPAVSLLPQQYGINLPAPSPQFGLTADEQLLAQGLTNKLVVQSGDMVLRNSYYEGTQRITDLGIAIPPQVAGIRTVVDWPRICVDPLVQRPPSTGSACRARPRRTVSCGTFGRPTTWTPKRPVLP